MLNDFAAARIEFVNVARKETLPWRQRSDFKRAKGAVVDT